MKKLVLVFAAMAAISFASCGNKKANAERAYADSVRIADSLAAVKVTAEAAIAAATDSIAKDSTVVE